MRVGRGLPLLEGSHQAWVVVTGGGLGGGHWLTRSPKLGGHVLTALTTPGESRRLPSRRSSGWLRRRVLFPGC